MNRLQWLQARKSGLGSSDSPAVVGVSPWGTPLDIYLSKTSPVRDAELNGENEAQTMGHVMEPVIARLYAQETGLALRKPPAIIRHPQLDWMFASLDYQRAEDGVIVECKNTSIRDGWGEEGTNQVPINYLIQVQHQMECADQEEAHIAVLFFGREFEIFVVERDYEVGAMILEIEQRFWHEHVLKRIPPDPDWAHPNTPALVKKLYQRVEPRRIELGNETQELVEQYQRLGEQKAALTKEHDLAKAKLLALMGEASEASLPSGLSLTRKVIERAAYSVPASSYVDFRVRKPLTTRKGQKERTAVTHEQ